MIHLKKMERPVRLLASQGQLAKSHLFARPPCTATRLQNFVDKSVVLLGRNGGGIHPRRALKIGTCSTPSLFRDSQPLKKRCGKAGWNNAKGSPTIASRQQGQFSKIASSGTKVVTGGWPPPNPSFGE